ncbi:MAG: DUF4398 domain-containing protein [Bacteroidales bacterium]|nr:DUF4398 domain-containing protein [Bacteroidales bacterium]
MEQKPSMPKRSALLPSSTWIATATLGCALFLAGCAGNPPTTELAVATQAINAADTAGGTQYAPAEIRTARDKLAAAERAVADKEYDKARRLAQQAEWDARVAERKAQAEKVQRALQDARQGVEELREESLRSVR